MKRLLDYLSNPAIWIGFIIFVFGLGGVWATTKNRVDILEEKVNKIDQIGIEAQLTELKVNTQWIMTTLEEIKRAM